MTRSLLPRASSGRPTAALLAVSGVALAVSLRGCSSDGTDEAARTASAIPTYATDAPRTAGASASATQRDDQGHSGSATASQQEDPAPGDVVVTYWNWDSTAGAVQVSGYVDGVTEDGGACTLTLRREGTELTGKGDALSDASTTSCGTISVTVPAGNAGDWQGVLDYRSSSGHSRSEPFTVTVR